MSGQAATGARLDYSYKELLAMTDEELQTIRDGLGIYLDTPQSRQARVLENAARDIIHERRWGRLGWEE
jgi:hypothetical protein